MFRRPNIGDAQAPDIYDALRADITGGSGQWARVTLMVRPVRELTATTPACSKWLKTRYLVVRLIPQFSTRSRVGTSTVRLWHTWHRRYR